MQSKGYLICHLNLAFSSLNEEDWPNIIKTCYHPLLELVEETGIPIGIELTGWTLNKINKIDLTWVERFKKLLNLRSCELIGSGYCQIIAPLVPYKVNQWNQRLGLKVYEEILGCKPNIALINEMAYSNSLVELYTQFGYKGFIMDRDNIRLALDIDQMPLSEVPTHAKGVGEISLPILWGDSILFQKVQHYAHGDILIRDYIKYINKRIDEGENLLPIYCNDVEIFDFRPGRFSEERLIHPDGEWNRVHNLLDTLTTEVGIQWISPSHALKINDKTSKRKSLKLATAKFPVPVKKQAKYNISRWALSGRDDLRFNTMCHRIHNKLVFLNNKNPADWKVLCELWSSDLRTHIKDKRWEEANIKLNQFLKKHGVNNNFGQDYNNEGLFYPLPVAVSRYKEGTIELEKEGIFLKISNENLSLELNLRRGLAIQSLAFHSHNMSPCIGTISHGYFSSILFGADFYSGGVVVELPKERKRVTDLEQVSPSFLIKNNGDLEIIARIPTIMGDICKKITIFSKKESISLSYTFPEWSKPIGSIRLGTITLFPDFFNDKTIVRCSNGGEHDEEFELKENVDHSKPSSCLVSSSAGFGATKGCFNVSNGIYNLQLNWDPDDCAVMPMLQHEYSNPDSLTRIFFSILELDDTAIKSDKLGAFSLTLSGNKVK
jgi:hypothetical protein